jgi:Holliday junction DNA helicase RuvA
MIGWITGVVRVRDPLSGIVVLDVGGVGYQLLVSMQTLAAVPEVGQSCELWAHTHAREDALELFGFARPEERRAFHLLLGVPQVGPRLAMGVLGGMPLEDLLEAVALGDRARLQKLPGVGKKTADRIILDLSDKVDPLRQALGSGGEAPTPAPAGGGGSAMRDDARAVLVNLGWRAKQVDAALDKVGASADEPLDEVVRRALAELMGGRSG